MHSSSNFYNLEKHTRWEYHQLFFISDEAPARGREHRLLSFGIKQSNCPVARCKRVHPQPFLPHPTPHHCAGWPRIARQQEPTTQQLQNDCQRCGACLLAYFKCSSRLHSRDSFCLQWEAGFRRSQGLALSFPTLPTPLPLSS